MADPKFCTETQVGYYAGAGASATSKGNAYILVYGAGAEAYMNCASRHNWSDETGGTNYADVSKILQECQAKLIAIDVINYDYSGFPTRIVAEDMINVLWARVNQLIKVLELQATVEWMHKA